MGYIRHCSDCTNARSKATDAGREDTVAASVTYQFRQIKKSTPMDGSVVAVGLYPLMPIEI